LSDLISTVLLPLFSNLEPTPQLYMLLAASLTIATLAFLLVVQCRRRLSKECRSKEDYREERYGLNFESEADEEV